MIDAAKGLAALKGLRGELRWMENHRFEGVSLPDDFHPIPVIAVPTTSGSGSEVTRWATIWDEDKSKHSLVYPAICPLYAILDPALCLSLPAAVTLGSELDAVSHAMESV